uniref:Uncharacterized protein n=1 Tax=Branchiostoma floridae TaxID=7739 RepID=C3ZEN1_BRAFL|eukprot:XP_002593176.1 hypothetical protein BRAFLDRAFT_72745 [Branchiostoma floridae]
MPKVWRPRCDVAPPKYVCKITTAQGQICARRPEEDTIWGLSKSCCRFASPELENWSRPEEKLALPPRLMRHGEERVNCSGLYCPFIGSARQFGPHVEKLYTGIRGGVVVIVPNGFPDVPVRYAKLRNPNGKL